MSETKDMENFTNFGKSFQESLAGIILQDRPFCDQIQEVLDVSYFEYKYIQVFVQKIFDHKEKYKQHPTIEALKTTIHTELGSESDLLKDQINELFKIITSKKKIENDDFVKDRSLDFCKKQTLKAAMIKSIDLLSKSSFDEISTVINAALKKGLDNNIGYNYVEDFEDRFQIKHRSPISTGLKELDNITRGGLGAGELGIIVASSGAGKSMLLVHFGAQAILAGKTVVQYTLELSSESIASRYDSCITHCKLDELYVCKDAIYETIKDIPGRLIIKEYPTKSASPKTIRNHLDKLKQRGIVVDVVIVDYGDILRPTSSYKEKRFELESVYEELRSIGQTYNVPVWSASQANRESIDNENVSLKNISESFSKIFPADLVLCLSRTRNDKMANSARIYVAKNRAGIDGCQYDLFFDPTNVSIKILGLQEQIPQNDFNNNDPSDKVKNSYKQFLKEQKLNKN